MKASNLQRARCALIAHEPWYGHAAMNMTWTSSRQTDTMGVRVVKGGEVQCLYNPVFVSELSVLELYAVIQHEIEHVVRCHCVRLSARDPVAWNIAADMAVNGLHWCPRIGFREGPQAKPVIPYEKSLVWVPFSWPPDENAEYYYRRLPERKGWHMLGRMLDDHSVWETSDVSQSELKGVAYALAKQAKTQSAGKIPGHLERAVADLVHPQLPWRLLLQRYLSIYLGRQRTTYCRRSRRNDALGVPGRARQEQSHVTVVVDVSGSISQRELSQFFAEVERICQTARVDVLLWDAAFQGFYRHYRPGDWKRIRLTGGGGTDMAAPVDWLVENHAVGDCVVLLTDGACNWPAPRRFPLISVLSRPGAGPAWGRVLCLAA